MYSYGPPHMVVQKQDDQHEHTFSSYVRIRDVVLKTYLGWWAIGRSGERGSGISVLPAQYDDDDDIYYHRNPSQLPRAAEYTDWIYSGGLYSPDLCRRYDTKKSDVEASVMLELWGIGSNHLWLSLSWILWPGWDHLIGSYLWVK